MMKQVLAEGRYVPDPLIPMDLQPSWEVFLRVRDRWKVDMPSAPVDPEQKL